MHTSRIRTRLMAILAVGLLLAAVAAFAPGLTGAQETAEPGENLLEVTGQGVLDVKPDTARISFGVNTLAEGAAESYQQAAAAMNKVMAAVQGLGITSDQVGTSGLSLNAEYDWSDGKQLLRGYRTHATVTVTTQDLTRVGPIIDAAVAAGANTLQGVEFLVKDQSAHMNAALDKAVDDARAKADRVAARLGTAVVGVHRVTISSQGSAPPPVVYARAEAAMGAAEPMPVLPGTSQFGVTVHVTFRLK